jgi:hypothetical protein
MEKNSDISILVMRSTETLGGKTRIVKICKLTMSGYSLVRRIATREIVILFFTTSLTAMGLKKWSVYLTDF